MTKNKESKKKIVVAGRDVGIVLESIDSKLDLVVEGHIALDVKIDKVDKKLEDFRSEVNYKFDVVFDELHLIRNELKEKVGRDEFSVLEKRVMALEKKVSMQSTFKS